MRVFSSLKPPIVVEPTPLPEPEQRMIRVVLADARAPWIMQPRLGAPMIIRILRRVITFVVTVGRFAVESLPRPPAVIAVVGARPPPLEMVS